MIPYPYREFFFASGKYLYISFFPFSFFFIYGLFFHKNSVLSVLSLIRQGFRKF